MRVRFFRKGVGHQVLRYLILLFMLSFCGQAIAADVYRIGVLAIDSKVHADEEWAGLQHHLELHFGKGSFVIKPMFYDELNTAARDGSVDFVLTNPAHYVYLENKLGADAILSLGRKINGAWIENFSGVIITRQDSGIKTLDDLKGKSFAGVKRHSLGGFLAAYGEMLGNGIDPYKDCSQVLFSGMPHENVVHWVLNGFVDAGTVRSGVLEAMSARDEDLSAIRVLNRQSDAVLPLVHSTALYPEWALVALPGVNKQVRKQVTSGLLSPDVEESQFRWEMPYGYKPVRQLMEQTQTPPFDTDFSWRDVASRYSAWLIASALMFGAILALLIRQYRLSFLLNRSRSRLQAIFDQVGEGIFLHSYTGEIHDVNAYGLAMFNVENRQQMSEMASDFIVPEDLVVFEQAMKEVRKSGSTVFEISCRHVDGSLFPVEVISRRVKFGRNVFVQSIVRDISVRKQAELRMQKFFKAMEASKEAILLTDKDGVIEYVNPAFEEVTGYSSDEAIGRKPSMLKSGEQSPSFYARLWSAIAGGHAWHGRMVERKKDGSFYPAYVSISPIFQGKEVVGYVGTHYDLTVQEKTEESLSKAQKMEAVGSLVAGIAHEFNNILAGMVGNLFLARRRLPDANHAAVEKIAKAEQLAKKATDMIAQLMVFSHKAPVEKKSIPFDVFIKEAAKLCQLSVPEDMMFSWHCHDEDLNVHGDPVLLQQVMVNLVNSAKHALEGCEQPEVRLNCEKFHPDVDFRMEYPQLDARDYVHVQVQDNGCGISSEHLSNIFEPFFTTKEPGVGTGLGLAMVKGTIESHQGMVRLESESGRGTIVHIYLPLIEGHPVESLDKDVEAMYPGKGETILLVDDDSMVLETMHEVLDQLGYRSLLASDGDEALAMLKVRKDDIQLIISDVVMPHCNGDRLLTTMRQQGITIPVIFTTGYSPDRFEQIRAQGMGEELVMLSKPVNFDELAKVMRQQLETDGHA